MSKGELQPEGEGEKEINDAQSIEELIKILNDRGERNLKKLVEQALKTMMGRTILGDDPIESVNMNRDVFEIIPQGILRDKVAELFCKNFEEGAEFLRKNKKKPK